MRWGGSLLILATAACGSPVREDASDGAAEEVLTLASERYAAATVYRTTGTVRTESIKRIGRGRLETRVARAELQLEFVRPDLFRFTFVEHSERSWNTFRAVVSSGDHVVSLGPGPRWDASASFVRQPTIEAGLSAVDEAAVAPVVQLSRWIFDAHETFALNHSELEAVDTLPDGTACYRIHGVDDTQRWSLWLDLESLSLRRAEILTLDRGTDEFLKGLAEVETSADLVQLVATSSSRSTAVRGEQLLTVRNLREEIEATPDLMGGTHAVIDLTPLRDWSEELDRFSTAESPRAAEAERATGFGGIGMSLSERADGLPTVRSIYDGFPASRSNLAVGDAITAVDGTSLQGWPTSDSIAAIRGEAGTVVVLDIERDGQLLSVPIERDFVTCVGCFDSKPKTPAPPRSSGVTARGLAARAREMYQARVDSGQATLSDARMLRALCGQLQDHACRARASTLVRVLKHRR